MSPRPADQGRVSEASTDLIDFKELVLVLWAGKKVVLWFTGTVAIGAILFAFWLPDVYESRILLAPKGEDGAAGLAGDFLAHNNIH